MAVGYCKDCIHYDGKDWCSLRREEHDDYDECTSSEGFDDGEE